ncbi:acyl-CoA dehydrogenase family protein [Streptomyces roseirectus]|uniref:acyl-CoA dehydrogenase family protein n=1 Tax=Streptomyces roseirectus TaxID=2768066 RepID=UPI001FE3E3AC|nr:acyl-CoA dehydrogenase family protein [Streptomyces roseirectus]
MVERIAEVDGSAGWVASFGAATVYLAGLPLETQAELYADGPDVVFAGGLFPVREVPRVEGGYRVSGRWRFASGCHGADVLGVGIRAAREGAGEVPGRPLTAVLRPAQVEIVENWDVVGLRGTGSHDLAVDGVTVPEEWTFVRGGPARVDEPLYRYPTVPYAAQVLAVVGLGVARAALDHVTADGSRPAWTGAPRPADRAAYRISLARAEAQLRSSRALFYETTDAVWATVVSGDPASREQASLLRLASAHLAQTASEVALAAYRLGGTDALAAGGVLERCLRDASAVPQHAFLQESVFEGAGAVLAGVEPFPGYV